MYSSNPDVSLSSVDLACVQSHIGLRLYSPRAFRWDMLARFGNSKVGGQPLPQQFFSDWTKVAEDEAK